ncbi:MAG TPA: hypothetical protein VFF22_05880 [Pseudomonas sp.]|nr:hypothetical protein [Pseudomonas sp.]
MLDHLDLSLRNLACRNCLVFGEGVEVSHCEIRLDGEGNLIEIRTRLRPASAKST